MSQFLRVNESCHTYEWVVSSYKWVMSHIWISHVTHMYESCQWVTSQTRKAILTHCNTKCCRNTDSKYYYTVLTHRHTRTRKAILSHVTDTQSNTECCRNTDSQQYGLTAILAPAPMNHVKYLRAGPAEMPFQNWYTPIQIISTWLILSGGNPKTNWVE